MIRRFKRVKKIVVHTYSTLEELDLLILNGWGDKKPHNIPENWRTSINPRKFGDKELRPRKITGRFAIEPYNDLDKW